MKSLIAQNRNFLFFLMLMFIFRSAIADWNHVPSGSMQPTIMIGDRILVNKLAYDVHLPFSRISVAHLADPQRGDIVIFESKASGNRLVKRVVGMPGDLIAMRNDVVSINGQALSYETISGSNDLFESHDNNRRRIRLTQGSDGLSTFEGVQVPLGHYLVLGDNRDNSADSRVIGFVPRDEIIGRSRQVVMSFNYDNFYLPRSDRFFHTL